MAESSGPSGGVRGLVGDVIRETFDADYIRELAREIKSSVKGVSVEVDFPCPHCGRQVRRKVTGSTPDLAGQVRQVTELLEQAEGRPGTAGGEEAGLTLVVERSWPTPGLPSAA